MCVTRRGRRHFRAASRRGAGIQASRHRNTAETFACIASPGSRHAEPCWLFRPCISSGVDGPAGARRLWMAMAGLRSLPGMANRPARGQARRGQGRRRLSARGVRRRGERRGDAPLGRASVGRPSSEVVVDARAGRCQTDRRWLLLHRLLFAASDATPEAETGVCGWPAAPTALPVTVVPR